MTDAEFFGDEIDWLVSRLTNPLGLSRLRRTAPADSVVDLIRSLFAARTVELCVWIEQRSEPVALRFDPARFRRDEERRDRCRNS